MAIKHAVIRTDLMAGTVNGAYLRSVRFEDEAAYIDNGSIFAVKQYCEGEREMWKGELVAAEDKLNQLVVIATPEIMYDERLRNLDDFYNEAGEEMRGYKLIGMFSLTKEGFEEGKLPVVGGSVFAVAGSMKLANAGDIEIGTCVAIETVNSLEYYVIECLG